MEWNKPVSAKQRGCRLSPIALIHAFTPFISRDFAAPPIKDVECVSLCFSPVICFGQWGITGSNLTKGWESMYATFLLSPWEMHGLASLLAYLSIPLSLFANSWAIEWYYAFVVCSESCFRNWYTKRGYCHDKNLNDLALHLQHAAVPEETGGRGWENVRGTVLGGWEIGDLCFVVMPYLVKFSREVT